LPAHYWPPTDQHGLVWTLKLRDGLGSHGKEPKLARDVVASIRWFAERISIGDSAGLKNLIRVIRQTQRRVLPEQSQMYYSV
jgi:hypothetical protein